jgi:diguanylate cyclase (GGDEF)-like protein
MPDLAAAVDALLEQVRSTIDMPTPSRFTIPSPRSPIDSTSSATPTAAAEPFRRRAHRLLFIDLDGFKEVNDSLGHAEGDEILARVAERLRGAMKAAPAGASEPLLARLAGDEFTILLPGLPSAADAERFAHAALASIAGPLHHRGRTIRIGASIGIAVCPLHGAELNGLMKAADVAMYHAKFSGRSQVCVYSPALAEAFERRTSAALGGGLQPRAERTTRL